MSKINWSTYSHKNKVQQLIFKYLTYNSKHMWIFWNTVLSTHQNLNHEKK